ncbi:hypothetical protein CBER1_10951 [Cercospora berteroae]|uniref:Uncharacterized protein n=1 Tax=Cercospora berteroae TaxID=357750 RepID=A0A2S6BZU6_9PEZI|nr:hypothetical protein CBER1_10951 [Cercospora berteroae]
MSIPPTPLTPCAVTDANQSSPRPTQRRTKVEGSPTWAPEHYAKSVYSFANSTGLFHGEGYANLGRFLSRPFDPSDRHPDHSDSTQQALGRPPVLYKWPTTSSRTKLCLGTIDDLAQFDPQSVENNSGALVFLGGYQSPEWLNAVGAAFHLDPAVLDEHLEYRAPFARRDLYTSPSLPSTVDGLVKLRYFTIGVREHSAHTAKRGNVSVLRTQANDDMDRYLIHLYEERDVKPGDSIARRYHVHSPRIYSIEQQITIGIQRSAGGGWLGVTLTDSGCDREHGLIGPWRATSTAISSWDGLLPIVMRSPKIALRWQHFNTEGHRNEPGLAHLQENYGSSLDPRIMANDPFYAMTELMQFAAFSICQLLNMIDSITPRATLAATMEANNYDISDLSYHKQLLDEVAQTLRENVKVIDQRGSETWPKAKDIKQRAKADRIAASLLADYRELQHRNQDLIKRCHNQMKIIMNQGTIAETQRSLEQAGKVTLLTRLAFMFVPLTFSTSFFGMNVSVFGQGTASLWLWFAITGPLMLVAFMFLMWSTCASSIQGTVGIVRKLKRQKFSTGTWV